MLVSTVPGTTQTQWFKYDGNPVIDRGLPGVWDAQGVFVNKVIFDGTTYRMWYEGWDGTRTSIGYAISADKVSWRKRQRPVLQAGPPGAWDSRRLGGGEVIFHRSNYHMWYTAAAETTFAIGYAWSADGITWTKHRLPILRDGIQGSWDDHGVGYPSVLPRNGGFIMWYNGWATLTVEDLRIGHAIASDETTWVKSSPTPVVLPGPRAQWDAEATGNAEVLFDGERYQMWFTGGPRSSFGNLGRAVSVDGINWEKSPPDQPVLRVGPPGAWDEKAVLAGAVLYQSNVYHLWYGGLTSEERMRIGYAVSPRGLEVEVKPPEVDPLVPNDSVRFTVRLPEPARMSFAAEMRTSANAWTNLVGLYDDGLHNDGLAGDGVFCGSAHAEEDRVYFVDLKLRMEEKKRPLSFTMKDATAFATVRHVTIDSLELVKDREPGPGDTLLLAVVLHHHGRSVMIPAVTATLTPGDSLTVNLHPVPLHVGDIAPSSSARTAGFCRLWVRPDCPPDTEVRVNVTLSSSGVPFLHEVVSFRVVLPWWKSTWARVVYGTLALAAVLVLVRYREVRKMKERILRLEQERALEHERARISQDMHDEVGSSLSEIAILSELARRKPLEADVRIEEISERTAELIDSMSEIVWAMDAKNDTVENLIGHVRRYAVKYLGLAGISCRFVVPETLPLNPVTADTRRNVFLVVKESLHNVVKHASATEVLLHAELQEHSLSVLIQDNGRGFDPVLKVEAGNGLGNMKKRMVDVGGTLSIESEPGCGTAVRLSVNV